MVELLIQSTLETILMVMVSTFFGVLFGISLAVLLFATDRFGLFENIFVNRFVGFLVNAIRSIPYIILVIAIIPITRVIVGTSIGTLAASVSLSIAAVMLYCRIAEDSLRQISRGVIEAAQSMGATRAQIIWKVVIPEALPSLISGLTLIIISLIGFSAMAGAVGGGGLGDLGIRYGYQRYDFTAMIEVIIILIIMVQSVQMLGDAIVKRLKK